MKNFSTQAVSAAPTRRGCNFGGNSLKSYTHLGHARPGHARWGLSWGIALLLLITAPTFAQVLTFVEFQQDGVAGVDGINGAFDVAVSPDGKHVYVTGHLTTRWRCSAAMPPPVPSPLSSLRKMAWVGLTDSSEPVV